MSDEKREGEQGARRVCPAGAEAHNRALLGGYRCAACGVARQDAQATPAASDELAALLLTVEADMARMMASVAPDRRYRHESTRVDRALVLLLAERDTWTSASGVTEPSELAAVLFNLGEERDDLRARAEEAERKLSVVADLQRSTAADLDATRAQLRLVSAGPADVWRWQGDGHDDPASLACPVVMSAETLRGMVAARERVAELEAERDRFIAMSRKLDAKCDALGEQVFALEEHARAATPPGASVAALLRAVEAARDAAFAKHTSAPGPSTRDVQAGRFLACKEIVALITATLTPPTALDRAVAEVCALLPREYPNGATEAARIASSKAALAALDVGEGDMIGARAQMADAAADLLAGMLACDAAPVPEEPSCV